MKKIILIILLVTLILGSVFAQNKQPKSQSYIFEFVKGNDMFFVPYKDNKITLSEFCKLIEKNKKILLDSNMYIGVSSYATVGNDALSPVRISYLQKSRVKSEFIMRTGVTEDIFITEKYIATSYGAKKLRNVVVVTLPVSIEKIEMLAGKDKADKVRDYYQSISDANKAEQERILAAKMAEQKVEYDKRKAVEAEQARLDAEARERVVSQAKMDADAHQAELLNLTKDKNKCDRWSVGMNFGIPFLWGDMSSILSDKTHIGFSVGLQSSYRISELLSTSLSIDYASAKIGAREYTNNYLLLPNGVTHYRPEAGAIKYSDLYSKVSSVAIGLSLDVNVNRIFFMDAKHHRFTVLVSPAIYGQLFNVDLYTESNDELFSDKTSDSNGTSLGLGGILTFKYRVCKNVELQFRNSLIWVSNNKFDGITTPLNSKDNTILTPQIGVIWSL